MKYVLAYSIKGRVGTATFDSKKSAQLFDTFLKSQYGDGVSSKLIYDEEK